MAQDRPFKTNQNASAANQPLKETKNTVMVTARQSSRLARLGHVLTGAWTLAAAMATAANLGLVQLMESQAHTLFFELRGAVAAPENIAIVAIDDESLSQKQSYEANPQKYAYLEPLQAWPWKRTAYAQVIERLMAAGAKSVAVDVVFDTTSSYGAADDERLQQVLKRYAGRVTLAAIYDEETETRYGSLMQLTEPNRRFWTEPMSIGSVNFLIEPDGKVHRLASEFPKLLAQNYQKEIKEFDALTVASPSFDEAALRASGVNYPRPKGDRIYFYGPARTFEHISFWHVLDPDNWNSYLQQGKYFNNKIVIIGSTATLQQDFHRTPFSLSWLYPAPMSGVELHANAIATLMQGRAIGQAMQSAPLRGVFVFFFVAGAGFLLAKPKRGLTRLVWGTGIVLAWGVASYVSFVSYQLILPTTVPVLATVLSGFSYLTIGAVSNHLRKLNLRLSLERHVSSPIVQEIISQQDDLQDLLPREPSTFKKMVGGHYKIVKVLSSGGFSETYIAEDIHRPGSPQCVVKQLRPTNTNPKHLQLARRLFKLEAEILEKLGTHNQIPRLLAYFEEDEEFYLVQEYIVGHPLSLELLPGKPIPEAAVIKILQDLLPTLEFVHKQNVIHRDIKPSNIIRRQLDGKLVLIDFGAVKEVTTQLLHEGQTRFTISIGTQGYAPNEQCAGRPQFSSDIYALGTIGIKAITGLAPHELELDSNTGEFLWTPKAQVSPELAAVLSKMVRYDFTQRYQSALEAFEALEEVVTSTDSLSASKLSTTISPAEDLDTPTVPWEGSDC